MVPPCSDRISRVPPYSRINWSLRIRGYHPLWPDFPDRFAYPQLTTGLFRVRSPLLAESLLMSFPPGTEMFQFPGFASPPYVFRWRYPCGWVAPFGYPRINACSRLPVAFRSVPRPSSPPGAKASTECPSLARDISSRTEVRGSTMHRNHPQRSLITADCHCAKQKSLLLSTQQFASEHRTIAGCRNIRSDFTMAAPRNAPEPDSHLQRTVPPI